MWAFVHRQVASLSIVCLLSSATDKNEESSKSEDACEFANNSANDRCVADELRSIRSNRSESACGRYRPDGA